LARTKFELGETVEMRCLHRREGKLAMDWLRGQVVAVDFRMLGVRLEAEVFANTGLPIPDRILWCTHGSANVRRPRQHEQADLTPEVNSND
jgi:hypothetical protein